MLSRNLEYMWLYHIRALNARARAVLRIIRTDDILLGFGRPAVVGMLHGHPATTALKKNTQREDEECDCPRAGGCILWMCLCTCTMSSYTHTQHRTDRHTDKHVNTNGTTEREQRINRQPPTETRKRERERERERTRTSHFFWPRCAAAPHGAPPCCEANIGRPACERALAHRTRLWCAAAWARP